MEDKTRETLKLFVEKACLLRDRNFSRHSIENGLNLTIKFGKYGQIKNTIPNRESIESSVLTTRMFFQDKDSISFSNIANLLNDGNSSDEFRGFFSRKRNELNLYLDSDSEIIFDGETCTNGKIFKIFVYGDIAHCNEEKRSLYLDWKKKSGAMFVIFEQAFATIFMDILILIWEVSDAVELELEGKQIILANP